MTPAVWVDYDFYANVFLGRAVGPEDFPRLAARAGEFIDGMCRGKCAAVPERDRDPLRFAVCAVAEILQDQERLERRAFTDRAVTGESVGNYSVSYGSGALSGAEREYLEKKKRDTLALYLAAVPMLKELFCVRSFVCTHHIR